MPSAKAPTPPIQLTLFDFMPDAEAARAQGAPPRSEPPATADASQGRGGGFAPAREPARDANPRCEATPPAAPQPGHGERAPGSTRPRPHTPPLHRHPRAGREIRLGEHLIGYELRRARRRTIGFVVGPEGLSVSAPRWVGAGEIDAALREKGPWILRKLHEQQERTRRLERSRIEWRDGAAFPFLGETVIVVLDPRITGSVLREAEAMLPGVPALTLHLGLPQEAGAEQIRDAVQSWLQRQAKRIFEERCAVFAQRLRVRVRKLGLSAAATRWGSANADGSIRLNWRLVHFALPVIDYVVTHELAHLREMNHSPAFWDVVRAALPEFEAARGTLRSEVLPAFE
jgi:predicted metal-dependent hydrolase